MIAYDLRTIALSRLGFVYKMKIFFECELFTVRACVDVVHIYIIVVANHMISYESIYYDGIIVLAYDMPN